MPYRVEIIFDVKQAQRGIYQQITNNLRGVETAAQRARSEVASLQASLRSLRSVNIGVGGGAAAGGAGGGAGRRGGMATYAAAGAAGGFLASSDLKNTYYALRNLAYFTGGLMSIRAAGQAFIGFNSTLEQLNISYAALLHSQDLFLDGSALQLPDALQIAKQEMKEYQKLAIVSVATTQELFSVGTHLLPVMLSTLTGTGETPRSVKDVQRLVRETAHFGITFGKMFDMEPGEIGTGLFQILTGTARSQSKMAKRLLSGEYLRTPEGEVMRTATDWNKWAKANPVRAYESLERGLQKIKEATREFERSGLGLWSTLKDVGQIGGAAFGRTAYEGIKRGMLGLRDKLIYDPKLYENLEATGREMLPLILGGAGAMLLGPKLLGLGGAGIKGIGRGIGGMGAWGGSLISLAGYSAMSAMGPLTPYAQTRKIVAAQTVLLPLLRIAGSLTGIVGGIAMFSLFKALSDPTVKTNFLAGITPVTNALAGSFAGLYRQIEPVIDLLGKELIKVLAELIKILGLFTIGLIEFMKKHEVPQFMGAAAAASNAWLGGIGSWNRGYQDWKEIARLGKVYFPKATDKDIERLTSMAAFQERGKGVPFELTPTEMGRLQGRWSQTQFLDATKGLRKDLFVYPSGRIGKYLGSFDQGYMAAIKENQILEAIARGEDITGLLEKMNPQINVNTGDVYIRQDFKDQDPDRVFLRFKQDLAHAAVAKLRAAPAMGTGR